MYLADIAYVDNITNPVSVAWVWTTTNCCVVGLC